ncbi:unnamed protein product, partial [Polarella glacialis]
VSLAVIGRVQSRISDDPALFLLLLTYFTVFYSILFEMVRHINLHISSSLARNLPGLCIVVSALLVIAGVLVVHLRLAFAQGNEFGMVYVGWVTFALLGHTAIQAMPVEWLASDAKLAAQGARLHVHHWYWSFLAAHFAIFGSPLSMLAQAAFLGIYIHGAACFGAEAIFEPVALSERDDNNNTNNNKNN